MDLVFSALARRLARRSVFELTYVVSSGTLYALTESVKTMN